MLKINNSNIDLVLHLEEYADINKLFNLLSLDIEEILIICPELFLQRFVHFLHENITQDELNKLEEGLQSKTGYNSLEVIFKGKLFKFNFIVIYSEIKNITNPIRGVEEYKVGFKEIKI